MNRKAIILFVLVLVIIGFGSARWHLREPEKPISRIEPEPAVADHQPSSLQDPKVPEPQKETVESLPLRFSPENGETLAYRFEIHTDAKVDFGFLYAQLDMNTSTSRPPVESKKSHILSEASGVLCLKFHDQRAGVWNVAAFVEDLSYRLNDTTPAYAETIGLPFAFTMNAKGYLKDFRFVEGISDEAKGFIRQLLSMMQTGLPPGAEAEWRTREKDANGTYIAEYTIEDASDAQVRLMKRKREYIALQTGKIMPGSRIRVGQSENRISVPHSGAWLLSFEGRESSSSVLEGTLWGESRGRFSAHRVSKDLSGRFPDRFEQFLADMNSQKYKKNKYYATNEQLNRLGQNLDMEDALAKFMELKNSTMNNARNYAEAFLVNYLRKNPRAAFDLVELLDSDPRRERYDQRTQLILWRLLVEAGHTEAQEAVIDAATDPEYSSLTHIRAVAYIHDFENPAPFLAQKLWELRRSLPPDSAHRDEQELRVMSAYAIGSLGHKDKLNDETKTDIGRQLTENLNSSADPDEQAVLLSAIGNYGGSEVLDDIAPYFSSTDDRVRASAYDALRRMDDPQAVELLARSVKEETSLQVRKDAYAAFAAMPPTARGVEWARNEVFAVESSAEQGALVKVLGENLKQYPENEQTLRNLLETDPDNRVKKDIYKYIVPK